MIIHWSFMKSGSTYTQGMRDPCSWLAFVSWSKLVLGVPKYCSSGKEEASSDKPFQAPCTRAPQAVGFFELTFISWGYTFAQWNESCLVQMLTLSFTKRMETALLCLFESQSCELKAGTTKTWHGIQFLSLCLLYYFLKIVFPILLFEAGSPWSPVT